MEEKDKKVELETSINYDYFLNGVAFKSGLKLDTMIDRCVNFENGNQWSMDEDIKDFPKITLNIIKQIGETKKSNIMQNEYGYLINSDNPSSIRPIQDFLKHLSCKLKIKAKDMKALGDDYTKGTAIGFFYWDAEKRGFFNRKGGDLRYDIIDIRNVVVASEYVTDIQDQEWIMYCTQETVASIRSKYFNGDENEQIESDGMKYTSATENLAPENDSEDRLVNVYVRYYRNEDGEVLYDIQTKNKNLAMEVPLNPKFKSKSKEEQPNSTAIQDERDKEKEKPLDYEVWNLYPFCKLSLNERDNCFYGIPVANEYIEAQKSINNHFSVYDKALQDNVLGGWLVRDGALEDEEITTSNGQVLHPKTAPGEPVSNAISRLPTANVPTDSANYSTNLLSTMKSVAGASNVMLGQSDYSGQSGKQTQMLLERAKENASAKSMLFNEYKREQAYIMFLFAKFYYDNESFAIVEHGFTKDNSRIYNNVKGNAFDGSKYMKDNVVIDIQVGSAPSFSEYNNIELVGLMVQSGQVPAEAYVSLLPENQASNKQELIDLIQNNSKKIIEEYKNQLEESKKIIKQFADAYKKDEENRNNVYAVMQENIRMKESVAEIGAKYSQSSREDAETIKQMTDEIVKLLGINGRLNSKNTKGEENNNNGN